MKKEVISGILMGAVIFIAYLGYDVLPLFFLAGAGFVLYQLAGKKGLLKNRTVGATVSNQTVAFNDIGGQAPAKQEIQEALEFMLRLKQFKEMGIRPLKGILLTGPPGTGKTLLAKAAANYTDSAFVAAAGSEFIEMYAGVGAQRVRGIFESARREAKKSGKTGAVIFVDEIEVLGGKRGSHSGHLEYDQTLNQLLVEMDGINPDQEVQILVMGATNRADLIDPALIRPGRFDRVVNVDLPDMTGRQQILEIHTANKPLAEDVDLAEVARETFGFSGAHLESLCNEAAIYALREGKKTIATDHFKDALDKVMIGEKAEKKPKAEEKERIAVHESGHALVSEITRENSVSHVTVTPRGNALGFMRQAPEGDIYLYTKDYLLGQIRVCLAGAIAEELFLGSRSSGAANDFQQATSLAGQIIDCGLSGLGIVDRNLLSDGTVHEEMKRILDEEEQRTRSLLDSRKPILQEMVNLLQKNENMNASELKMIIGHWQEREVAAI